MSHLLVKEFIYYLQADFSQFLSNVLLPLKVSEFLVELQYE